MNKLLMLPLAFMFVLTITGMFYDPTFVFSSTTENLSNPHGGVNDSSITIPGFGSFTLDFSSPIFIIAFLVAVIIVGIVIGITIMGSGLSDQAQSLAFNAVLYLGLWAVLSVFAAGILFSDTGSPLFILWIVLTIIYVIGFASEQSGSGSGDG